MPDQSISALDPLAAPATTSEVAVREGAQTYRSSIAEIAAQASPMAAVAPEDVDKSAAAVGTDAESARADHKHDVATAAPGAVSLAAAGAEGASASLARADHIHQSNTAPAAVTKATAAIGTSSEPARADHKHDVSTAAAIELTDAANAEGAATTLARSNHTHAHGNRGGGTLHADAVAGGAAGFLSGARATAVDAAIVDTDFAGSDLGALTRTGAGTYVVLKANHVATTAPGVSNDSTEGYAVGSPWVDVTANNSYICVDASSGAAVWEQTNGAGGGASTLQDAYDGNATIDTSTDAAPVAISQTGTTGPHDLLTVNKSVSGSTAGRGIGVTMSANTFEEGIEVLHSGSGTAIRAEALGTGDALQIVAGVSDEVLSVDAAGEVKITPGPGQKLDINMATHITADSILVRLDTHVESFLDMTKTFSAYTGFGTTSGGEFLRCRQVGGASEEVSFFVFGAAPDGQVTRGDKGSLGMFAGDWYIKEADGTSGWAPFGAAPPRLAVRTITTATATADTADNNSMIEAACTTADCVITLNSATAGDSFVVTAIDVTYFASFAQGAGVTIESAGDIPAAPAIQSRYRSATIRYITATLVRIDGDLSSVPYTTLQQAYDVGADIVQDVTGGQLITKGATSAELYTMKLIDATSTDDVLQIEKTTAGAGDGLEVTMGASATGRGVRVSNSGSGTSVLLTDGSTSQLGLSAESIFQSNGDLNVSVLVAATAGDLALTAGASNTVGNVGGDVTLTGGVSAAASGATPAAAAGGIVVTGALGGAPSTTAGGVGGAGGPVTLTAGTGGGGTTAGMDGGAGADLIIRAGTGGAAGDGYTPGLAGVTRVLGGVNGADFLGEGTAGGDVQLDSGAGSSLGGTVLIGDLEAFDVQIGSATNAPDVNVYGQVTLIDETTLTTPTRTGAAADYYAKHFSLGATLTGLSAMGVYTGERDPNGVISGAAGDICICEDQTVWLCASGTIWASMGPRLITPADITGTTYTADRDDHGSQLFVTGAGGAVTFTVNSGVAGDSFQVINEHATNNVTFAQGAGVTIRSTGGTSTAPVISTQWAMATVHYKTATTVQINGDIT